MSGWSGVMRLVMNPAVEYFSTSVPGVEANAERKNESEVDEIMPCEKRYEIGLDSAHQPHCQ
jgi:hypothetical protein